jgi:hypothetical protein
MPEGYRTITVQRQVGTGQAWFHTAVDRLMSWEMHRRAGLLVAAARLLSVAASPCSPSVLDRGGLMDPSGSSTSSRNPPCAFRLRRSSRPPGDRRGTISNPSRPRRRCPCRGPRILPARPAANPYRRTRRHRGVVIWCTGPHMSTGGCPVSPGFVQDRLVSEREAVFVFERVASESRCKSMGAVPAPGEVMRWC